VGFFYKNGARFGAVAGREFIEDLHKGREVFGRSVIESRLRQEGG
jgi:hypothetical protein